MGLNKFLASVAFGCVAALSAFPQAPEWPSELFKVKILSDSYHDLVKRLGTPMDKSAEPERSEHFQLAGGKVSVVFTNRTCESSDGDFDKRGWNVPERTVEKMYFDWGYTRDAEPNTPYTLKERHIDLTGFTIDETEFQGTWFRNDRTGIDYQAIRGFIVSISYRPSKEQEQKLRCGPTI